MTAAVLANRPSRRYRPCLEALEDRLVLDHAPLGPEFQVNQQLLDTFHQANVAIASDDAGNFVVVWTDDDFDGESESGGIDVFARIFDRDGNALTGDIQVANDIQGTFIVLSGLGDFGGDLLVSERVTVDVAMENDGDIVVAYSGFNLNSTGDGVGVVFFNSATPNDQSTTFIGPQTDPNVAGSLLPSVTMAADGKTYVTYQSFSSSGSAFVQVQRFDDAGQVAGGPITVSDDVAPPLFTEDFSFIDIGRPAIAADDAGNFVVAYNADVSGGPAIAYRLFDAAGNAITGVQVIDDPNSTFDTTDGETYVSVGRVPDVSNGDFVISWTLSFNSQSPGVYAQRFNQDGTTVGGVFQVNTSGMANPVSTSVDMGADGRFVIAYGNGGGPATIYAQVYNADGTPEQPEIEATDLGPSFDFGLTDVAADRTLSQFELTWNGTIFGEGSDSQALVTARIYREPFDPVVQEDPVFIPFDPFIDPDDLVFREPGGFEIPLPLFEAGLTPPSPGRGSFTSVAPVSLPIQLRSGAKDDLRIGEISGKVFLDLNGNGFQDEGEDGLPGQRVFLDMNDNAVQEKNEPGMDTDEKGRYIFTGLALTRYRVRQILKRVAQTAPPKNGPHEVELTAVNSSVNGRDFGAKIVQISPMAFRTESAGEESSPKPPPDREPPSP